MTNTKGPSYQRNPRQSTFFQSYTAIDTETVDEKAHLDTYIKCLQKNQIDDDALLQDIADKLDKFLNDLQSLSLIANQEIKDNFQPNTTKNPPLFTDATPGDPLTPRASLPEERRKRFSQFKKKLLYELDQLQGGLDGHLQNYVSQVDQLNAITLQSGYLDTVLDHFKSIQENTQKLDKLVDHYDYIKQVSMAHQNVNAVKRVYERFVILNADFEKLSLLFEQEFSFFDSSSQSSAENSFGMHLLNIYELITSLNEFHQEMLHVSMAKGGKEMISTTTRIMNPYLKKLEQFNQKFHIYLWEKLCPYTLDIILSERRGQDLVASLFKVIEKEESKDTKALKLQEAMRSDHRKSQILKSSLSSLHWMSAERTLAHYNKKFMNALKEKIVTRFSKVSKTDADNLVSVLGQCSFIMEDLEILRSIYVPSLPEPIHQSMTEFFLMNYQEQLYLKTSPYLRREKTCLIESRPVAGNLPFSNILASIKRRDESISISTKQYSTTTEDDRNELSISELLELFGWIKTYEKFVIDIMGMSVDEIEPHLLDHEESKWIQFLLEKTRKKLRHWMKQVYLQDERLGNYEARKKFSTEGSTDVKETFPEADSQGHWTSPSSTLVFQLIHSQIDPFSKSKVIAFLFPDMMKELVTCLLEFFKNYQAFIDAEYKKIVPDDSVTCDAFYTYGFEYVLIMLGNHCLRWMEALDSCIERIEKLDIESSAVVSSFKKCQNVLVQLMKNVSSYLVKLILYTVKPLTRLLFRSPEWYDCGKGAPLMATCVVTLEDFLLDFSSSMIEFFYKSFVNDLFDHLILIYLERLIAKHAVFKAKTMVGLFEQDLYIIKEFLSIYCPGSAKVFRLLTPIEKVQSILTCSPELLFMDLFSLIKAFPDIPLKPYLELLLARRPDLISDSKKYKSIMDNLYDKLKEETLPNTVTIFSRLALKQSLFPKT